eukprot:Gb_03983 [translate_table: standard]
MGRAIQVRSNEDPTSYSLVGSGRLKFSLDVENGAPNNASSQTKNYEITLFILAFSGPSYTITLRDNQVICQILMEVMGQMYQFGGSRIGSIDGSSENLTVLGEDEEGEISIVKDLK